MKRLLFFFLASIFSIISFGQGEWLFSVGDEKISTEEFVYIYNKSNQNVSFNEKQIKEYLELYSVFKLKVKEAENLGYQENENYLTELQKYKTQLASSYFLEKMVTQSLVAEVQQRKLEDVAFSNIFIPTKGIDTLEAFTKISEAQKALEAGKSFEDVNRSYGKLTNAYIGYYNAFQIPGIYGLENALYNTPVGQMSGIVKSDYGYHILLIKDKRPALGMVDVAQLLIRVKPNVSDEVAKNQIDKIYERLEKGENFEDLVRQYSEDSQSKDKGGKIGLVTVGQYANENFEKAIYQLNKDGDFSKPILTDKGWHIVKRLSKSLPYENTTDQKTLVNRIKNDSRYKTKLHQYFEIIKKIDGFKKEEIFINNTFSNMNPDFLSETWKSDLNRNDYEKALFTIGDKKATLENYVQYVMTSENVLYRSRNKKSKTPQRVAFELFESFYEEQMTSYIVNNLEKLSPDFKNVMREYEEGILMFNISKDKIWDVVSKDEEQLKAFYQKNANEYQYNERAEIIDFQINTLDQSILQKFALACNKDITKALKKYAKFNAQQMDKSLIEKNIFEKKYPGLTFGKGQSSTKENDVTSSTVSIINRIYPKEIKPYEEVKGFVTSAYQSYLEKEWIESLKQKYPVTINQAALEKIYK